MEPTIVQETVSKREILTVQGEFCRITVEVIEFLV